MYRERKGNKKEKRWRKKGEKERGRRRMCRKRIGVLKEVKNKWLEWKMKRGRRKSVEGSESRKIG